jgi:hypothetical protein
MERFADLEVISNNILDKKNRYYLGNFSIKEAISVFKNLAKERKLNNFPL